MAALEVCPGVRAIRARDREPGHRLGDREACFASVGLPRRQEVVVLVPLVRGEEIVEDHETERVDRQGRHLLGR